MNNIYSGFKKIVSVLLLTACISHFSYSETIVIEESELRSIISAEVAAAVDIATAEVVKSYENKIIDLNQKHDTEISNKDTENQKLQVEYSSLKLKYDLDETRIKSNLFKIIKISTFTGIISLCIGFISGIIVK